MWRRRKSFRSLLIASTEQAVRASAIAAFAAALATTALSGIPRPLPGIAMGSTSLFYIERGVIVFAVLVVAVSLLARGLRGELPSQVSTTGLTYPESLERAVSSSDEAISALAARLDRLDEDVEKRDQVLRLLASQVLDLSTEIERSGGAGPSAGG
jgi:hypothetical protein